MRLAILLGFLAFDTSGRREPVLQSEDLGDAWTAGTVGEDRGLSVQEYYNRTLRRSETWHQSAGQEWFVKTRDGLYVLGVQEPSGRWRTHPSIRLVRRVEAWRRVESTVKR